MSFAEPAAPFSAIAAAPPAVVKANGVDICFDSFGNSADPTILLVMGLGAQMLVWDADFCRMIAREGFHVVRFDNRDVGLSQKFPEGSRSSFLSLVVRARLGLPIRAPYKLRNMASDAIGLLNRLGVRRAHVVGASMGGMIVQEMAIHWPERLLSMTSIMSTTGDARLPGPTRAARRVLLRRPARNMEEFVAGFKSAWAVLRGPGFDGESELDEARARTIYARNYCPDGVRRQLTAIVASGDRTAALGGVRVPTLVIHGDSDPLVRPAAGEATARAIPGARLVLVERMGHAMPQALWPQIVEPIVAHARAHAFAPEPALPNQGADEGEDDES